MATTARERLAHLLRDSEPAGSFSAQLMAPPHVLQLEVSGVGPVGLPVRAPLAKKLIAVARPAMFGRGEETLTDTSVRDTWELTPDQITLGGPGWTALMERALEHFRDELGLPRTSRLRAEPALDAGVRQGAVLPPPPGLGEGRRDGGHAGGVAAVGAHRWGTRHRPCRAEQRLPRLEGGADLRRVLRRLPSPGHAGQVRVPGDAHVQPALRRRDARLRRQTPPPSWRTA